MSEVTVRGRLELLADLERAGGLTPTQLTLPPDTPYEQWEAIGALLGTLARSVAWVAGDWVDFGETVYGEKYADAVDATGLAPQTLMNYASVARRIPPDRRRATLPFSSHAIVASLSPEEQDHWLDMAEREDWTRAQLAEALGSTAGSKSLRELATDVWLAAVPQGNGEYRVPGEVMRALAEAL